MWINRVVQLVLPRQDIFFVLLEELAARIAAAADVFAELLGASGHHQFAAISARLKPIETDADRLCHRVYEELDRNFVTPIAREDIAQLTGALDNVIDDMEHTAAFAALFRFETLPEPMRELIRITTQAAAELVRVVANLRQLKDPDAIRGPALAVHILENQADAVYRRAIEELFSGPLDARDLVRQKDLLSSLETGVDRCEDAMDVLRSVVVKSG